MVINPKPVNVIGFSIAEPVGLGGSNQSDDIFVVKTLLNRIAPKDGGADETLDVSNLSSSPDAMEPLIDAILVFQRAQPGLMHDGRVDPEKNTIKRMRSLSNRRKGGGVDQNVSIMPDGPIFGPCDSRGFSAAELRLNGDEWSGFDPFAPVRQMVPVGKMRKLRVRGTNDTAVGFVLNSSKASIVEQTNDTVTVAGLLEGEADLIVPIEGQRPTSARLLVRGSSSIAIDVVRRRLCWPKFLLLLGSPGRIRTSDQPVNSVTAYCASSPKILAQAPEIMMEFRSLLFPRDDKKGDLTSTLRPDFHPLSTLRPKESCKVLRAFSPFAAGSTGSESGDAGRGG
jgi:hypothetical protein